MSTLIDALIEASGDPTRVGARALDRHAAAHDASHFLLTPEVVVTARDAAEVGRLFAVSAAHGVPLTLRAGGTSLAGQAVSDGVLVDVRPGPRSARSSRRRRQLRWRLRTSTTPSARLIAVIGCKTPCSAMLSRNGLFRFAYSRTLSSKLASS